MNINELKKQLQNLGVSTSTPGLNGDERFEELSFRLESAQNAVKSVGSVKQTEKSSDVDSFVVPSLNQLSIGEIRSRLTALGESTATPGVTGEERRVALMRRLIDAVCINDEETNISSIASTIVSETLKPTSIQKVESPVKVEIKPVPPVSPPAPQIIVEVPSPEVTAATISALKNDLKRLVNQRAMAVASKLSGTLQDEQLKLCEAKLARIENEITQFKSLLQKGESKVPAESVNSEFLVLNPATTSFAIDSLISRLEGYRSSTKDKIREHRLRIREEGDIHPQFGVAVEEKLKIQLSDANLAATKIPTGKGGVSRARQKLTEVKDIESQLQEQGHIKEAPASPTLSTNPNTNGLFDVEAHASAGAPSVASAGRGAPGTSPKDKPPVHNPANKILTNAIGSSKTPLATPLTQAALPLSGKSRPIDKWSTEITPSIQPSLTRAEPPPSKAEILASKIPNFTSSFLGKAIDLDSGSHSVKGNKEENEIKSRAPVVVSSGDSKPLVKPVADSTPPKSNIETASSLANSSCSAYVLWPVEEPSPPPSPPPEPESSASGPVGSIKLSSSAAPTAPPVIPGRRPPPPLTGSSSSQKPPGADLVPATQHHHAGVGISAAAANEEDAAFDFHIAEFDEDHDEYFREANEAASRKSALMPAAAVPNKETHPIRRGTPKQSTRHQTEEDDEEEPVVRQALSMSSASRDSDYDNTHETAGVYVPEDDNLDSGNDDSDGYDGLYGTRRRLPTAEDDDDLEELPGSRSSRSPAVRSPIRSLSNSSFGEATSSRLDPLPENQSPLESHSDSQDERHEIQTYVVDNVQNNAHASTGPTIEHNTVPHQAHGAPIHHMPSIDEDDDATPPSANNPLPASGSPTPMQGSPHNSPRLDHPNKQSNLKTEEVNPSPPPQKTHRPVYNLAGKLETADEETRGNAAESGNKSDDDEGERVGDEKIQIRVLRSHAKVLEGLNDVAAAEAVHMRALELDPTNISTLEGFAQFLHQKKGELARAEAFFNRGLQVCLPGLVLKTGDSAQNTPQSGKKSISRMSFTTDGTMQGSKIKHIIKFILSYAHFLSKAKGDIEAASILYKKGIDLCPEDALLLATYAHFLAQLGDKDSNNAAAEYFQRALKISPGNAQYAMWYGKLLKKTGKTGQAELMYKVALERSKGNEALEPTAMCNYATFVFKQRRDPERAQVLFQAGLAVYPNHKGLRKNFAALVKAHPEYASGDAPTAVKRESKSATDRAQRLAQSAMDSLNEAKPPLPATAEEENESNHSEEH